MNDNNGMQVVYMKKDKVLEILKENRKKHKRDYFDTLKGYKEDVQEALKDMLERLKDSKPEEEFNPENLDECPTHHLEDYDRHIQMLEMDLREDLVLSVRDFNRFILDQWEWKSVFENNKMVYTSSIG